MPRQAAARTSILLLGLALIAAPAHAGWGDALKKQADKAIKGEKKPAAENATTGPVEKSRLEIPPTPENMAAFKASLQFEISERTRITKTLANVKTPDAYEKCKVEFLMSDEGQKLSQKLLGGMDGKSGEELQKHTETVGKEILDQVEKRCGLDPNQYNQSWARQEMHTAFGKASDQFKKDDYAYQIWKEWITEFCQYIEELKKQPDAAQKLAKIKDEGLRIPGSGTGIYYVYTASEANQLLGQCESLMPLIQATL